MKKIHALIFFLLLIAAGAFAQQDTRITTFILLRHAEKGNDGTDDPDLNPEGVERSKRIAAMLKNTSVDAIYSTKYKRAKNTVVHLAGEKGLAVTLYEPLKSEEIDKMLSKHPGGTIVVSGHSNTIPWMANQLVGKEEFKNYPDSEYGNILIVSVKEKGKSTKVTWLNF